MKSFSFSKLAIAAAVVVVSANTMAQTKAPEPDYSLAYNVGVVTDYRYRGIMQSQGNPAVQGGVDFTHKNGVYLGAWGSTINWISETCKAGGTSCSHSAEVDLYGGYKGELAKGFGYDVGLLNYWYVSNKLAKTPGMANANTSEVYLGLSYGPISAKYSHSLTNMLGVPNSKNSNYLEVNGNFDLGSGYTLVAHLGHQKWKNSGAFDYTDYKVGVNKDLGNGLTIGLAAVGTDADKAGWTYNGKFWGKSTAVLSATYAF